MRTTTILVLAIVMTAAGCDVGSDPATGPTGAATGATRAPDAAPTAGPSIPDEWTTHAGDGFEISTPADWETTQDRGEWAFNVQRGPDPLGPWVSVEAAPSADVDASQRLDLISGPIALSSEDFEVVDSQAMSWSTAPEGLRQEVTYVGPGPDGEDLDIHEYLVVAIGAGIDVHVRAAALDDEFGDVAETLQDIIATLVVQPESFEATPSEDATA